LPLVESSWKNNIQTNSLAGKKGPMPKPQTIPQVYCVKTKTPPLPWETIFRLVLALVSVYFMISAWDDFLDEGIRHFFHLQDTLSGRLIRAFLASVIAAFVLMILKIDLDDLMGIFVHD
jgi:hypothetical protein